MCVCVNMLRKDPASPRTKYREYYAARPSPRPPSTYARGQMSSDSTRNHKTKKAGKKGRIDRGGANLGRAMIKTQFPSAAMSTSQAVLETERGKHKLRSVTQCDDLEDLMANAMLAGTDFSSSAVRSSSSARGQCALERVPAPEG